MTYSKKQMQPLINKYGINPETNKLFIKVCEMFDGQANYQNWAVRMIFSQAMSYSQLEKIHEWIVANSNLINKLEKKNITAYSDRNQIDTLLKEIEGLDRLAFIKNIISHFNTEQKKILMDSILGKEYKPIEAYNDASIKNWYDVFKAFNKKPMGIKNKFYSSCSALKSKTSLHQAILDCLKKSYVWKEGKEDLLAFIEHNTKDCEVVFNEGPCVVVEVPSFDSSHKLCGSGRTQWCIAREESYFKSYVLNHEKRKQYFLFDFSRKETDAFAHVGFTIEGGNGIVEAQTCNNYGMIHPYEQNDERLSIYDVLNKFNIPMSTFMRLPKNLGFNWNISEIIDMAKAKPEDMAIAYDGNGRLVVNFLSTRAFRDFVSKTFIDGRKYSEINQSTKIYLLMDFNLPIDNDKSLVAMQFHKDEYGIMSLNKMQDIFGADITKDNYLEKIGMTFDDFLNREAIDPLILLHKYIDENDEVGALKLIEKERGNINVNYEFNQRIPIFSAMSRGMMKLFDAIVNHDGFKPNTEDGFGETLLESLIYLYGSEEVTSTDKEKKLLKGMIDSILASEHFDFNSKDLNNDTAINAACEYPSELWIVEALASMKDIDINVINDFDCGAVANCLNENNLEALKIIGQRPDLVIRDSDRALAKSMKINLNDYIKPDESIFGKYKVKKETVNAKTEDVLEFEMAMA